MAELTGPSIEPCDFCAVMALPEYPCKGVAAHCADGRHCTSVMEICAIDFHNSDHNSRCCHCYKELGSLSA
jgi:hypothetical protein